MAQQLINTGTVANDKTGTKWRAGGDIINDNFTELYTLNLDSRVIVKTAADLSGALDSTKFYFIDGIIDFTGTGINIEVPTDGLSISGGGSRTSRLICSDPAYTLFTSPGGGSGGLICCDVLTQINGAGSKVFDINNNTGTSTVAFENVTFFCVYKPWGN